MTGATVTQPAGSPPAATIDLGAVNPNDGDKVTFNFNLPDGTSETISLTATTTNPPPAGSFLIGVDTAATTANLQGALTSSIQKLERYLAGGGIGDSRFEQFLQSVGNDRRKRGQQPSRAACADHRQRRCCPVSRHRIRWRQASRPAIPSPSTARRSPLWPPARPVISSTSPTAFRHCWRRSISITGTTTPSTVTGGAITLHGGDGENLTVTSSNTAAFTALGLSATATATPAPLRVNGPPFATASNLIAGTSANTVSWYTGETGTRSRARHRVGARRSVDHRAVRRARQ